MKNGKIVGGRIPNTTLTIKFLQGSSKGVSRLSERFEGNLIKVLNNNSEQEILAYTFQYTCRCQN